MDRAGVTRSPGGRDDHRALMAAVRAASAEVGRPVGIMVDLSGPKIRVGELEAPMQLEAGQTVVMAPEDIAVRGEISTTYSPLAEEIQAGDRVLLDDGLLELSCTGTEGERTRLEVVRGGLLKGRKGINLPLVDIRAPSLTEKDLADLDFALTEGVEYTALSFVRRAEDVVDLKARVGNRALVVAKIEKVQALRAIEEILPETDAVMVARGDLGVELPFERVPLAQKRIIQLSNFYARPVITATQMLESMIEHARPTRAEASDVANAILDGTDAVMLSAETAMGAHPVAAVNTMREIALSVEKSPRYERRPRLKLNTIDATFGTAIAMAAAQVARALRLDKVICFTESGGTVRLISRYRPGNEIIGLSPNLGVVRQMTVLGHVRPALFRRETSLEEMFDMAAEMLVVRKMAELGQEVVFVAGVPPGVVSSTNVMKLHRIGESTKLS